ncbi:MAG: hypothetical protein QOD06_3427 [Candidatus Binatota bacterium]|jgi:hypothetical protein|nr:hypothetical protein [Candidatus Binatota bacterium]
MTTSGSNAGDSIFTLAVGTCAVVAAFVFIAIGSMIARATFSPHSGEHHAPAASEHAAPE